MLVNPASCRGKRGDLLKIFSGMTVSGCCCMPKDWSAAGSSGHHRPMVSFRSQLHSLATCSRGSTGDIRNKPGVRWQRDEPKNIRLGAQDIVAAHERCVIPCGRGGRETADLPNDVDALKAALTVERAKMPEVVAERDAGAAELAVALAKASEDLAMIAQQKLRIAKLERQLYGPRSERSAQLVEISWRCNSRSWKPAPPKTRWPRKAPWPRPRQWRGSRAGVLHGIPSLSTCPVSAW